MLFRSQASLLSPVVTSFISKVYSEVFRKTYFFPEAPTTAFSGTAKAFFVFVLMSAFINMPGKRYLMGVLNGKMVTLNGNIRLTSSGSFGITPGVALDVAVAPTAIRPAFTTYFNVKVYVRSTSPYVEPSGAFDAMMSLDSSGVLRLIPYPNYTATPVVYNVAGQNIRSEEHTSELQSH